ncbi:sterol desaturase family protein [Roseovarius sp. 2305UL8-3]|uniref:sterol desaturase family protein n=1 Tax=Roseovarius conchicola TaxID=3121636 RepID=UPI0035282775
MTQSPPPARKPRQIWNYTPDLPLRLAPYWDWPMRPVASLLYLLRSWNPVAQRFLFLLAAFAVWAWFTPDLARAETLAFDWIFEIWLRNLVILLVVAGGLHLVLWKVRIQADDYRYDMRPMMKGAKVFTFKNQVWDNMFWTLGPALAFVTFWEALMWHAYANGWVTMITFADNPIWFLGLIVLIPIWAGFHFYWLHRLLHVGWLYKRVHAWHHRNINTGPWSGLAMHPVESFFLLFDTMIFLLIPAHPVHVLFLIFHHLIGAPTSHAGFEHLKLGKAGRFGLGDFFHQLHHKFFDCNYGTWETPWDKWFNTFHDGTTEGDDLVKERRRKIWAGE